MANVQLSAGRLDDVYETSLRWCRFSVNFLGHPPKVLILQSATARGGRGSHFFGSVHWVHVLLRIVLGGPRADRI